jgi:DNA (cytosine-5)-methyltransferase 1
MEKLNALDLFSGIGGNTLALSEWTRTIAYCDFDKHAQSVLLSRMRSGDIKPAPIWDDVSTLTAEQFSCPIDIIVGGFPCQDISVAGKGAGINEETRSGLFFQVVRLVRELRPTFIFLENVPAIRTRGLDIVLRELTQAGYDCRWTMLSASSVGALHKRERWFLLAHTNEKLVADTSRKLPYRSRAEPEQTGRNESSNSGSKVANSEDNGRDQECSILRGRYQRDRSQRDIGSRSIFSCVVTPGEDHWAAEPGVGRVVDGIPLRVDRLKRLGNSVVPQQAKKAFEILIGLK